MLDHLYRHVMRARRRWYAGRPGAVRRLSCPVVAVGNLSLGGTGKTPVVSALASRLVARGERPAILSRGYGRRRATRDPLVVSDGTHTLVGVADAGDEPTLLARLGPGAVVVVGADRYRSGLMAERTLGCTVHLLDDGFQHVQLGRDLDLLVTTPGEIAGGRVLPFGRLREGAEAAAAADVLVVVGASAADAELEARRLHVAQSCGAMRVLDRPEPIGGAWPHERLDPERLLAQRVSVVAVAGIAHPDRFFDDLRRQGWQVARGMPFGDHHRFSRRDVARVAAAVADTHAEVVLVTGKDAVKLEALGPLPFPAASVPMRLVFDPASAMDEWIDLALGRRRPPAPSGARR